MTNVKVDLADLFRHINSLNIAPKGCLEEEMELDFYKTVFLTFTESLVPDTFSNLIPIEFKICSIEKAKEFASSIGMNIVEGGSGRTYLSYSKGFENKKRSTS